MHRKLSLSILLLASIVGMSSPILSPILNGQLSEGEALPPLNPLAAESPNFFATGSVAGFPAVMTHRGNRTDQALAKAIEKYRKAESDSDARRQAKDEIAKNLGDQYDAYMKDQEKHLDQMEKKLAKLREQLKLRKSGKQKMVDLKLEMVLAQIEGLGWPEQSSGGWLANPLQSRYRFETTSDDVSGLLRATVGEAAPFNDEEPMEAEAAESEAPRPARNRAINGSR